MATAHSRGTGLWVDKYNLQQRTQEFAFTVSTDMAPIGGLSANEQVYLPGQRTVTLSQAGVWDDDSAIGPDVVFDALASAGLTGTIFVPGSTSTAATTYILDLALLTNRTYPSGPGDAVKFSAAWQNKQPAYAGKPPVARGKLLGSQTVTGAPPQNGTGVDFGAAGSAGLTGILSVTAFTGTSAVIWVQHSPDNLVWSDLVAFDTVTATVCAWVAPEGSVNRYVRWRISSGTYTSITFAVAAAIYGVNF